MNKAFLGLGVAFVVGMAGVVDGGCSGNVTVDFGGAGGKSSTAQSPVTTGASMVTSGTSMVTTTTAASMTGTSGTTNVAVSSTTTAASMVTTTGATMVASSSTGGGPCMSNPNDNPCTQCAKQSCCADLTTCVADVNCACWAICVAQNPGNPGFCFQQCGGPDQQALSLGQCTNMNCPNVCGGGNPAGSSVAVGTSTGSGGACSPAPGDTACTSCAKMNCCMDVDACTTDPGCGCWVQCIKQGGTFSQCNQSCGPEDMTTNNLFQCSIQHCQGQCP